jgi:uncharacterized protein with HEPN domain
VKPTAASDLVLLAHMLDCIARIREYTGGDRERFFGSRLIQDAVIRNLQVMAESSQRLSAEAKALEPNVPWAKIAGMRNILVHPYLGGIDADTIWAVVERDLGSLSDALECILRELEQAP